MKMNDIRQKLNLMLISVLVIISVLFIVYMIVLYELHISLAPEAYAQIVSALATLLVVVLTLGLRLIDDTLSRYERFSKSRITGLQSLLGPIGTQNEVANYHVFNLPNRSKDLAETASNLMKYGRFFLTRLYPKEALNKVVNISNDLKKFLTLIDEMIPYYDRSEFEVILQVLVSGEITDHLGGLHGIPIDKEFLERERARMEREKPHLIDQIRTIREKVLLEIKDALKELTDFLEAN
jgi:hypothetical protein